MPPFSGITQLADATDPDGTPSASAWQAVDDETGGTVVLHMSLGATLADATARFNGVSDVMTTSPGKQIVYTGRGAVLADVGEDGELTNPVDVIEADDAGGLAVVLVSPGSRRWRLTVTDAGALNTTEVV